MVCFKTSYEAAIVAIEDQYHDLIAETLKAGCTSTLITVEMGIKRPSKHVCIPEIP